MEKQQKLQAQKKSGKQKKTPRRKTVEETIKGVDIPHVPIEDLSNDLFKSASDFTSPGKYEGSLKTIVENIERDLIKTTLANNRGNITKTSQKLGLTRKGLTNKIDRYNIEIDFK